MSWQTYVDSNLVGSGKVAKAAIVGQKGGIWATSPGFKISPEEEKAILSAHTNLDHTQASGLRIAGQKYFTLSCDSRSIYLKKSADGALVVKTKQGIIVAIYEAPIQHPECAKIVEGLADYLISVAY